MIHDTPEMWLLLNRTYKQAVVTSYSSWCSIYADQNKRFEHSVILAVYLIKLLKDLSRQALRASALTETSRTSGRFSKLVTVKFSPFMNYSLWNDWMYAPSFSFPWIVDLSIRILKRFDFETTSTTFMNSPFMCAYKFPTTIFIDTQRSNIFLEIQNSFSRN